jgi:pilus assembly protein Flp/PilA
MQRFIVRCRGWFAELGGDEGATAVEYALMVALIAMVIIGAVTLLGQNTNSAYSNSTLVNAIGG